MTAAPRRLKAPPIDALEVWLVDLNATSGEAISMGIRGDLLDDNERERARRFVFDRDRNRYIAAHCALRALLSTRTGTPAGELRFESGPFGKPSLQGPAACTFNLSHSATLGLIALASSVPVGADIEVLRPIEGLDDLARSCLTRSERDELAAIVGEPARLRAFLYGWTRKEACLKALGVGLQIAPNSFEVGLTPREQIVTIETPGGSATILLHPIQPPEGIAQQQFVGSVACIAL